MALVETQLRGGGDHRQGHLDDWAPALFTGSVTHRLLLIPNSKEGTGRPLTYTRDLQEELGGGSEDHRRRGLLHRLQTMVRALQNCMFITDDYVKKRKK